MSSIEVPSLRRETAMSQWSRLVGGTPSRVEVSAVPTIGFMFLRFRVTSIQLLLEFFNSFAFEAYEASDFAVGVAVVSVTDSVGRCDDDEGESNGFGTVGKDDAVDGDDAADADGAADNDAAEDDASDDDAVEDDAVSGDDAVNGSGAESEEVEAVPSCNVGAGDDAGVGVGVENGDERDS